MSNQQNDIYEENKQEFKQELKFMPQCSLCGAESIYKEGFNKEKNKPWAGNFCQNKDCKNVDWVKKGVQQNSQQSQGNDERVIQGLIAIHQVLEKILKQLEINITKDL